ncbi:hypothetical protein U3516DRAFT_737287 [Neocallimastix sp. 'constans']
MPPTLTVTKCVNRSKIKNKRNIQILSTNQFISDCYSKTDYTCLEELKRDDRYLISVSTSTPINYRTNYNYRELLLLPNTETYYLNNSECDTCVHFSVILDSPITLSYCDYSTDSLWDILYTLIMTISITHIIIMLIDNESLVLDKYVGLESFCDSDKTLPTPTFGFLSQT